MSCWISAGSSGYYSPVQADEYELELMGLVDKQYLLTPFYGSRKMAVWLRVRDTRSTGSGFRG